VFQRPVRYPFLPRPPSSTCNYCLLSNKANQFDVGFKPIGLSAGRASIFLRMHNTAPDIVDSTGNLVRHIVISILRSQGKDAANSPLSCQSRPNMFVLCEELIDLSLIRHTSAASVSTNSLHRL